MTWRYRRPITLLILVGAFLGIREWIDRRREERFDTEIIRDDMDQGDAHLGRWAQKNDRALIQFRLKRDGRFNYEVVTYPGNDTISYVGWHEIISGTDPQGNQHPRLIAVSDTGDTLINHFVSLTRATKRDIDILKLTNDFGPDVNALLFRRFEGSLNPDELEAIQTEDEIEWRKYSGKRNMLTAVELIGLADCRDIDCVQLFMKDLSPDFTYGKKGEYFTQLRSVVIDTAGNQLTIPLSTFYVSVEPQATWRAAHTVHTKALGDTLFNEFSRLGFTLSGKNSYVSKNYPGKTLYIKATFNPWRFKGMYNNNVTWPCYVFEVYKNE